jgi:hypothetical protein
LALGVLAPCQPVHVGSRERELEVHDPKRAPSRFVAPQLE